MAWGPLAPALLAEAHPRGGLDAEVASAIETIAVLGPSSLEEIYEIGAARLTRSVRAAADAGYLVLGDGDGGADLAPPPGVELLQAELRHEHPVRVEELLDRQAAIRERTGFADAGLTAARRLGDQERVARIIDRWGVDLAHGPHGALVHASAAELPLELARGRPGLAWRFEDLGRVPVGTVAVVLPRTAREAREEFLDSGDLLLKQALQPLNTRRRLGRWDEAMAIVRAAEPLAQAAVYPWYGDRSSILPYWYLQAGITAHHAGDLATARRLYLNAWTYRERDGYGHTARVIAAQLALLDAFTGSQASSASWLQKAEGERSRPELWMDRFREALEAGAAAIHAVDHLAEDVENRMQPAFDPSQRHGHWPTFLWAHVRLALTRGNTAQARQYVDDALLGRPPEETETGLAALLVPLVRAQIHLASGQAIQAMAALDRVPDLCGLTKVLRARTLLLADRPREALGIVTAMAADTSTSPRARTEAMLLEAAAHHADGNRPSAVRVAHRAVFQVMEHRVPRALASIPRVVLDDLAPDVPTLGPLLEVLDRRGVTDVYPESVRVVTVTEREHALLRELRSGQTLTEIARAHFVSVNTTRTHLANLRRKLDARSRSEVLVKARLLGLLDDHGPEPGSSRRT